MIAESGAAAPLLTVAIPTYNRAGYLRQNLEQLRSELAAVPEGSVEVLVSDNCSPDETPLVVQQARAAGVPIRYVRNERNLGWGPNFAQCFELASGKYVLLLGDDDLFVDGTLAPLLQRLASRNYGVVILGAYGYDEDYRAEFPGSYGRERSFRDSNEFFVAAGLLITLTSSCVLNKSLLPGVSIGEYASGDLASLPLVLRAALAGDENLYLQRFVIASKRQNSFNYEFGQVFVKEMWGTIDKHAGPGLTPETIRRIERNAMFSYYPFYLLDLRLARRGDHRVTRRHFDDRFGDRLLYRLWLAPTLILPRPLAVAWGIFTTAVGRVAGGELRRGLAFVRRRLARRVHAPRPASPGPS